MAAVRQKVTFPSDNVSGDGQGVMIGDPQSHPKGLIVLHEWWGLNEQIQDVGSRLSHDGFCVLVVDVYRGKVTDDREEAGHYMGGLDWTGALHDISGGARHLLSKGCDKVGVTGFCMGGALSLAAAAVCPEISAAAPFYGVPPASIADVATIKIPVQAHYASRDITVGFSSPAEYKPMIKKMEDANVPLEFNEYDAPHGFVSNTYPENYDEAACELSMKRLNTFMHSNLKKSSL